MDRLSQQPGLEVVPSEFGGSVPPQRIQEEPNHRERRPAEYDNKVQPQPVTQENYLYPVVSQTDAPVTRTGGDTRWQVDSDQPWYQSRRTKRIAIAMLVVLVVAGIVIGSVVGTAPKRANQGKPTVGNSSGESSGDPAYKAMRGSPDNPTSAAAGVYPTAISYGFPHLEVIALASNRSSVWRKYRPVNATALDSFEPPGGLHLIGSGRDLSQSASLSVGGRLTSDTVTGTLVNRTEIHLADSGGAGYRKYHDDTDPWTGSEASWDPFPHNLLFLGAPTQVTTFHPGLELMKTFAIAQGEAGSGIWYLEYYLPNRWQAPVRIPSVGSELHAWAPPAAVAWNGDDTRLDVMVVSSLTNRLLRVYKDHTAASSNAAWSEPEDLGGFITTPPVLISRRPESLDVFARGGDGGLWHLAFDKAHWTNWTLISGTTKIQGQPEAVSASPDTIDVFAWGQAGGELLHRRLSSDTGKWTPTDGFQVLTNQSTKLAGPPKAVTDGTAVVNVFAYDQDWQLVWQTLAADGTAAQSELRVLGQLPNSD